MSDVSAVWGELVGIFESGNAAEMMAIAGPIAAVLLLSIILLAFCVTGG